MNPLFLYLITFGAGLALSVMLTPVVRSLALARGQVAVPKDDRWHRKETALLGGVGLFLAMVPVWAVSAGLTDWTVYGAPALPVMVGAGAVFILGLADDLFGMDPQHKLAGQIIIASGLVFFGFRLEWTGFETINLLLSVFWIVGITNAFNLLDNMDGLAAGIAFIGGGFLFLYQYMNPEIAAETNTVLLADAAYLGALLGFLIFNFNPASIFMGDAGSLSIGFLLACLTVMGSPSAAGGGSFVNLLSVIAIPLLILFIPILDTGFVSVMRKLFRRPISRGGRDHSSHRMVAIGFSERKAVLVLYAVAGASGLIALTLNRLSTGISIVVVVLYLLCVLFFWIYLGKVKVYPEESILSGDRSGGFTPILVEVTYKRRLFEVLLDFVLISVAYYTAYLLRFEGEIGGDFVVFIKSLPILIACQILSFYVFGVYRGVWKSTSLSDLIVYAKAVTAGTIAPVLILLFAYRFYGISRAVFVIYWFFMLILVSLSRLSFRLLDEELRRGNQQGKPALIYGAGIGGQMALREVETNRGRGLAMVGFIDDDPGLHGRKIKGYPVFGGEESLEDTLRKYKIEEIIVSFKDKGPEKKREIGELCRKMGLEVEVKQMRLVIS